MLEGIAYNMSRNKILLGPRSFLVDGNDGESGRDRTRVRDEVNSGRIGRYTGRSGRNEAFRKGPVRGVIPYVPLTYPLHAPAAS